MTVENIRFRMEGELVVLQVLKAGEYDPYLTRSQRGNWADATAQDLLDVGRYLCSERVSEIQNQIANAVAYSRMENTG